MSARVLLTGPPGVATSVALALLGGLLRARPRVAPVEPQRVVVIDAAGGHPLVGDPVRPAAGGLADIDVDVRPVADYLGAAEQRRAVSSPPYDAPLLGHLPRGRRGARPGLPPFSGGLVEVDPRVAATALEAVASGTAAVFVGAEAVQDGAVTLRDTGNARAPGAGWAAERAAVRVWRAAVRCCRIPIVVTAHAGLAPHAGAEGVRRMVGAASIGEGFDLGFDLVVELDDLTGGVVTRDVRGALGPGERIGVADMPLLGALLGEGLLGSPAVDDLDRRVRWHGVVLPNDIAAADAEAFAEATGRRVYCATGAAEASGMSRIAPWFHTRGSWIYGIEDCNARSISVMGGLEHV